MARRRALISGGGVAGRSRPVPPRLTEQALPPTARLRFGVFGVVALSGLVAMGVAGAGAGAGLVCAKAEGASGPAISSMAAKAAAILVAKARG